MFNRGQHLKTRRDEIIMACLSGGQHIDAALEAADRLVPQSEIDEARAEDQRLGDEWLKKYQNIGRIESMPGTKISQPWYVSAISKWLPF